MTYCPSCGEDNPIDSNFCLNCGTSLPGPAFKEIQQPRGPPSYIEPSSYKRHSYSSTISNRRIKDEITPVAYLCACCVPIAGFVIWAVVKDDKPESANSILIISIISIVFSFFFGVLSG